MGTENDQTERKNLSDPSYWLLFANEQKLVTCFK